MNGLWKNATTADLIDKYPNTDKLAIENFLNEVVERASNLERDPANREGCIIYEVTEPISQYPEPLLNDGDFLAIFSVLRNHEVQTGYSEHIDEWEYDDRKSFLKDTQPGRDMHRQIVNMCRKITEDYIHAFKQNKTLFNSPTSQALPTSPKDLKKEINQSMSEFKSQQRDYYAKWEEWRGAKEEWLDLAMDEDNLSQRAEWSIEACQKQIRAAALQAINAGIDKAAAAGFPAKAIYAALQPQLDPDGFYLLRAAEKITGFKVEREYPIEDGLHHFEAQNGFGMMRYLEAAKFGERTFKPIAPWTEVLEKYKINFDAFQLNSHYLQSSFTEALTAMRKSASFTSDFKQLVSVAANMQSFDPTGWAGKLTPQALPKYDDGWVNISDHLKKYALPYVDEEQRYYEQYKMPASTDYRMYDTFMYQPDDKVPQEPAFDILPSQETRTDKLLNIFRPERETARLQSELKVLTNNTNVMRDFIKLLDKSIIEMKGEIAQMRELSVKATQEIESGKHANDWVQLNLKPELKALGLDADKAGFRDLMNRLGQNIAEAPQALEEAYVIE